MKSRRQSHARYRVWIAVVFGALCCGSAPAQDATPETPPELRDFRLDSPPPREEPIAPQPAVKPAEQRPEPPKPKPEAKRPTEPSSPAKADMEVPKADSALVSESAEPEKTVAGPASEAVPQAEEPALPKATAAPLATASDTDPWAFALAYWPVLAAFLVALLGFAGFRWWQSRPAAPPADQFADAGQADDDQPMPVVEPGELPKPSALTARFEPGDARLSVANLTITGRLTLRYDGSVPLAKMSLRTMIMSVCEGQAAMIASFHEDPAAGEIDSLERIMPGEEIALTLELQVSRASLQAFDWSNRRFVAPLILINISSGDGAVAASELNYLVGQMGDARSPRLLPLPIDRGPMKFDALQFRAINRRTR